MDSLSQNVKVRATPFFHGSAKASEPALLHIVGVDKNDGPNHLKAWREFREMSQETLAEKIGTTASQISMLETGDRGLSTKWLRKLAPALGTTPGHLLDHDPADIDSDVFDIWIAIGEKDRATALRVLKSFKTGTNN